MAELSPAHPGTRSGFVALAGRPNVGKSTLVNAMVGRKVAIVSDKPQTTRRAIRGVATRDDVQIVLTDRTDTGAGNFDIYFNYTRITWETGSASGGSNGFGGVSAAVGYNAGTGNQPGTFFELPGSRVPGSSSLQRAPEPPSGR